MEKMTLDGPKWGQEDFFLLIQIPDLADILGDMDFDVEMFFLVFWIQHFQISRSQILKFPEIWLGPALGRAWALGRAGPLGWARRPLGWAQTPPPAPDELSDPDQIRRKGPCCDQLTIMFHNEIL